MEQCKGVGNNKLNTITCSYNVYPIISQHLGSKTGEYRGMHFFLILIQNIDCVYSLEPPRQGGSNVYPQSMF